MALDTKLERKDEVQDEEKADPALERVAGFFVRQHSNKIWFRISAQSI